VNSVVQIVQHLRPGGIETMALDLARFSRYPDTVVVSLEGTKEDALQAWPRLGSMSERLLFLNKAPGIRPGLVLKLSRLLKQLKPVAVHTHHIGPLLYGGMAARMAGIKHLIHTEHDAWHLNEPKRRKVQQGLLTLLKPTLVADSDSVALILRGHFPTRKILTIRNGIDSQQFMPGDRQRARKALRLPMNAPLIGCSGRLEPVKGHHLLIEALTSMGDEVHLAIAGGGSLQETLRQQAMASGLLSRVHFLGHLDSMPTFYQAIDLFCLPSYQEGFPLSSLEAQACGVPSLVTDAGGAAETLCPDSGRTVCKGNAGALADTLRQMLGAPSKVSPRGFVTRQGDVRGMVRAYEALCTGSV
jgi:glycosyltransferase involved in cell wall biosynthesis